MSWMRKGTNGSRPSWTGCKTDLCHLAYLWSRSFSFFCDAAREDAATTARNAWRSGKVLTQTLGLAFVAELLVPAA